MSDSALRTTLVDLSLRVTALERAVSALDERVLTLEHAVDQQDHVFDELDAGRSQVLLILHELSQALETERTRLDQALGLGSRPHRRQQQPH